MCIICAYGVGAEGDGVLLNHLSILNKKPCGPCSFLSLAWLGFVHKHGVLSPNPLHHHLLTPASSPTGDIHDCFPYRVHPRTMDTQTNWLTARCNFYSFLFDSSTFGSVRFVSCMKCFVFAHITTSLLPHSKCC